MIVTFEQHENPELFDIYYRELKFHAAMTDRKLASNYRIENMDINSQLAFSIAYNEMVDSPTILSSIYRRSTWPVGMYRILNRTWKPLGEEDILPTRKVNALWAEMIDSQIHWLKTNVSEYTTAIISREHNSRNTLIHLMEDVHETSINRFELLDERVWLCENKSNPESCYQDVIYTGERGVFGYGN